MWYLCDPSVHNVCMFSFFAWIYLFPVKKKTFIRLTYWIILLFPQRLFLRNPLFGKEVEYGYVTSVPRFAMWCDLLGEHMGAQSKRWSEALSIHMVVGRDLCERRRKDNLVSVISANVLPKRYGEPYSCTKLVS